MDLTNAFIPRLVEYSPTEFSTGVNTLPVITVAFSLDMKIGTFGPDTEAASAYLNEYVILSDREAGIFTKVMFVAYDNRTKTLSFTTATELNPGGLYTISILAGFAADSGRGIVSDTSWKFNVANTDVETVQLVSPVGASELVISPIFAWEPVSNGGATYHLQISDVPTFTTLILDVPDQAGTYAGPLTLPERKAIYWRVRAEVDGISGNWGETNEFIIKPHGQIVASGGTLFDTLGLVSVSPPVGASNLPDWPSIVRLRFNKELDPQVTVQVRASDVDTDKVTTSPDFTQTVNGSEVRLAFTGSIQNNTRYMVVVDDAVSVDGASLLEPATTIFTGTYLPLYSSASVLRNAYGRFLGRYTDEETNFQIHRSSIKCNRVVNDSGSSPISALLVEQTVTFDMSAYVETHAAYCLIQAYMYELLEEAGRNDRVDTVGIAVESRLLRDIEAVIADLAKEVKRLEVTLKGAPSPVSGVRSSGWDPSTMYDDKSIAGIARPKF